MNAVVLPMGIEISTGLCLPSLLRPEKMPGYSNKQGTPALNAVNILMANPYLIFICFSGISK
ncbi:MAG: hypothetical protein U5K54_25675 [Cytophagales bacterium]|nr:hypothetical protein [Cytophagales bacterium]